jgi:hypothetical protein
MVDTTTKTKAAMLHELESIKGLLLENDEIPILQEVENIEPQIQSYIINPEPSMASHLEREEKITPRVFVEEQQDFFESPSPKPHVESAAANNHNELLDTIEELEKHTAEVTAHKLASEAHKSNTRPSLAKATGENPFLPAHIRSRLHGNNPPPLFAQETARKIASTSVPSRLLGNTSVFSSNLKGSNNQQEIIDNLIDKFMPEIEHELRSRLEAMSKQLLDELNKQ